MLLPLLFEKLLETIVSDKVGNFARETEGMKGASPALLGVGMLVGMLKVTKVTLRYAMQ